MINSAAATSISRTKNARESKDAVRPKWHTHLAPPPKQNRLTKQCSSKATTSSASKGVRRPTLIRSRGRSAKISFRLPVGVYVVLRDGVPNVSGFLRRLVCDGLERLPVVFDMEEYRLEIEVARINEELEKVHRWQKLLLKHGSYAEAYLEKLKGGIVTDRKPHFLPEPPPYVKPEELVTVSDIVKYREKLAKQLVGLLNRLMELKLSRSPAVDTKLDGGEKQGCR